MLTQYLNISEEFYDLSLDRNHARLIFLIFIAHALKRINVTKFRIRDLKYFRVSKFPEKLEVENIKFCQKL